jgi:glycerate 2-kinase
MDADRLLTHSLRAARRGADLTRIMAAALQAVDPAAAVRRFLRRDGNTLFVAERAYDLRELRRVIVLGAGKAGAPMADAAAAILGDRIDAGLVIVKEGYVQRMKAEGGRMKGADRSSRVKPHASHLTPQTSHLDILEGGHPLPDARGVAAAEQIAQLAASATADDLVLLLLSGGGSALLTLPADGITLQDKIAMTDVLLRCGATINEINALRKHVSRIKGGRLAELAAPAQVAALILSDVVGSPLDVIASGPTAPDPTTYADAWNVIGRYHIADHLPASIILRIQHGLAGHVPETPKPENPIFERVQQVIVGSNGLAALAAAEEAQRIGLNTLLLTTYLQGEAYVVGGVLAAIAREIALHDRPVPKPALVLAGGETTVTLRGDGVGGRNQELALGAVDGLRGLQNAILVALATDGGDGPTDAAGAVATGESWDRAHALELDPHTFLRGNDAYHFFMRLDDLLKPGPTRTNVNDLLLLLIDTP